jgi:ABC-type multidrug transport system fused ATPase/permease subunit
MIQKRRIPLMFKNAMKKQYWFTHTWFWQSYTTVKGLAFLSLIVLILYMLTNFIIIGVQKSIIDDVFMNQQFEKLPLTLLIFAAGFLGFAMLNPVNAMIRDAVYSRFLLNLSTRYMQHIGRIPLQEYQKERVAQYVYHFSQDIRGLAEAVTKEIPTTIQQTLYIILLMGVIGWISPVILAFILLFSVMYVILGRCFAPNIKKVSMDVQERKSELLVHIEEGISSTREVIAYHRLKWERAIYDQLFGKYFQSVMKEGRLENKHLFLSDPMRWGANIVVLGYGGYLVLTGQLSIGWLVVIYQFCSQLMEAMQLLFQLILKISGKMAYFNRLDRVFQTPAHADGVEELTEPIRKLSFDGVSFIYNESKMPVLENINLSIHKGQKVAFVGTSGGGKSTLLQLISRDFDLRDGEILVNGVTPLNTISRSSWASRVQIVFQEPYLFQETIETNVRLGRERFTIQDIERVCRIAHIHDFVQTLPNGYQTVIGERGITLSGGQRQRLALARALLNHPDILVLDEATSALDTETERKVQHGIDDTMQGGIMIVVAHRLSTIENADVIYVLDQGSIVELGTHIDLMTKQGAYARLYDQQKRYDNEVIVGTGL